MQARDPCLPWPAGVDGGRGEGRSAGPCGGPGRGVNGVVRRLASEAGDSEHVGAVGRVGLKARGSERHPLPATFCPLPGLASVVRVRGPTSSPAGCPPHSLCPSLAAAWLCLAAAEINWICSLILKGICGPQQGCWSRSRRRFVDSRVVLLPLTFLFHLCCGGKVLEFQL